MKGGSLPLLRGAHLGEVVREARRRATPRKGERPAPGGGISQSAAARRCGRRPHTLSTHEAQGLGPRAARAWLLELLPGIDWCCVEGAGWAVALPDEEAEHCLQRSRLDPLTDPNP